MKNEYGVQLDRNGYAPSLMQDKAMEYYGWSKEDFIREIGKNYLD